MGEVRTNEMPGQQQLNLPSDGVSFCPNEQHADLLVVASSDFAGEVWAGELSFYQLAEDGVISKQSSMNSASGIAGCAWVGDERSTVITGHDDGSLTLWSATEQLSQMNTPHTNVLCVSAETGSPTTALTGGADHAVRVWDLNKNCQASALQGHTSKVHAVASNDPNVLISGSSEGVVLLWDKRQEGEPKEIDVEGGR